MDKTEKPERNSAVRIAFRIIREDKLWQFFGKDGAEKVIASVKSEYPNSKMNTDYFQWLKSRFIIQKALGKPTDRLVPITREDRARLRQMRLAAPWEAK